MIAEKPSQDEFDNKVNDVIEILRNATDELPGPKHLQENTTQLENGKHLKISKKRIKNLLIQYGLQKENKRKVEQNITTNLCNTNTTIHGRN